MGFTDLLTHLIIRSYRRCQAKKRGYTPAIEAGIADHVWRPEEIAKLPVGASSKTNPVAAPAWRHQGCCIVARPMHTQPCNTTGNETGPASHTTGQGMAIGTAYVCKTPPAVGLRDGNYRGEPWCVRLIAAPYDQMPGENRPSGYDPLQTVPSLHSGHSPPYSITLSVRTRAERSSFPRSLCHAILATG